VSKNDTNRSQSMTHQLKMAHWRRKLHF